MPALKCFSCYSSARPAECERHRALWSRDGIPLCVASQIANQVTTSMTYASSKKPDVDVPESRADPESGTVEPLGRPNSFTLKAKTSVHWQELSGPLSNLALTSPSRSPFALSLAP